jgi:PAS domain S-box-containing protein
MYSVLYVDDEPALLTVAKLFLERTGEFKVEPRTSAVAALAYLAGHPCDAVIADYQMPELDGIAFLKAVRQRHGDLPFIITTGRGSEAVVIEAINNGADFYVQKGGDPAVQYAEIARKTEQAISRRRVEQALRETRADLDQKEEYLRTIFNAVRAGIVIIDAVTHEVIDVNPAALGMYGGKKEDLVGKKCHCFICPAMEGKCPITDLKQTVDNSEQVLITATGERKAIIKDAVPLTLQGRPCILETFIDNTDRKRAEEARMESERRLMDIIAFLPEPTYAINSSGRVIAWNRAVEELTGVPSGDMIGRGNHEYSLPFYESRRPVLIDLVDRTDEVIATYYPEFRREGDSLVVEADLVGIRGGGITALVKACPLRDIHGEVTGAIASLRDISRDKAAEKALLASEKKYRDLADLLPQMVYEMDLDFRITFANKMALSMFGLTEHDLQKGLNAFAFIDPSQHAKVREVATRIQNGSSFETLEFNAIGKDGRSFPVVIFSAPVYQDNVLSGYRGILIDISERKKMEHGLRESEKKFRTVFEHSPYPIAVNSYPDGAFMMVNAAFLNASGYTVEEVTGKNPVELGMLSVIDSGKLFSRMALAGKIEGLPITLSAKEKKRVEVIFSSIPVTIDNRPAVISIAAEVTKLRKIEKDVIQKNEALRAAYQELSATEEKLRQNFGELSRQEKNLRESEEKFRALVDTSLEGVLITDYAGKILFVNQAAGRIVDIADYKALAGKESVFRFIAPESRQDVLRDLKKVAEGTDAYLVQYKILTDTQRELWVECIGKNIRFQDSQAILISMRDITERREEEERHRESENTFTTMFRSNPVALTLVSATDGRFVDVNDSFIRDAGYSREEAIGKTSDELALFPDPGERQQMVTRLRETMQVQGMEMVCRNKNGEKRDCLMSSSMVTIAGKPHILSTIEDITERKKTGNALKMANRQLNLLSGITRHDILNKTLMVLGFLALARSKNSNPALDEYFEQIDTATKAIQYQVEFTRIYKDLGTNEPLWVPLEQALPVRHVPPSVTFTSGVGEYSVFADPMLEKVFFNLLDNSLRHGEHVTAITVSAEVSGDGLTVVWEDNGVGIRDGEKETIFNAEYGKNTGLGLFLAREILSLTGITIRETGMPVKGARFEILVPKEGFKVTEKE